MGVCSIFAPDFRLSQRFSVGSAYRLVLTLLILSFFPSQSQAAQENVEGEFIMKFAVQKRFSASRNERRVARATLGVEVLSQHKITGSQLVRLKDNRTMNHQYAKDLLASGVIDYIEPNFVVTTYQNTPNDPRYAELWGMNNLGQTGGTVDIDIDAPEAWELSTGNEEVVVGVVDTGVNYLHPDLAGIMWRNPGEIPANGIDDDENGVVDDVFGFNAREGDGDPFDENGHGSHVAGTIGAHGNNSVGVSGVNWNVRVMALQFLGGNGSGDVNGAIAAIEYAIMMKNRGVNLRVLNNSWGGGEYSRALEDVIREAENAGILFVAAAGNSYSDNDSRPAYPSSYQLDNVVSVAAVDSNGNLAEFSNYGALSVDVAAPGVGILSTHLADNYQFLSGTSMAAPHVSGVAALVLGREPNISLDDLEQRITQTVKLLPTLNGLASSPGIVSAKNALLNIRAPIPPIPPLVRYAGLGALYGFEQDFGERVLTVDDGYVPADLPFEFPFYGASFKRIAISSNGRIIPLTENQPLLSADDYSNALTPGISPYHDDLVASPLSPGIGGVYYKATSNVVTVTWIAASYAHRASQNPDVEIRFQAKLFIDGRIEFHYEDTFVGDPGFDHGGSATVGINPVSLTRGNPVEYSHNSSNSAKLGNGTATAFSKERNTVQYDYDGDGKSDLSVWRPSTGMWFILESSSDFSFDSHKAYQMGLSGDVPLSGDYDGDGKADLVVWRPSNGTWYIRESSRGFDSIKAIQWGLAGDQPLVGDYDGDAINDLAIYRRSEGAFYVLLSSGGFNRIGALAGNSQSHLAIALGGPSNDPVVGDIDADGKDDFITVWQLQRFWTVKNDTGVMIESLPWGEPGDTPLTCDVDGDNKSDRIAVRVASNNLLEWYAARADGSVSVDVFGSLGDKPTCDRDFDGDGTGDLAVFRPHTGEWFVRFSSDSKLVNFSFGLQGDQLVNFNEY